MDWNALKNLRHIFLSQKHNNNNYWKSTELLQLYDETFAARIGWKWDSVLTENKTKLLFPESYALVDWGAGSGVATRKFLSCFIETLPSEIILIEQSELAQAFAKEKIKEIYPSISIATSAKVTSLPENYVLLVSHVMTELGQKALSDLVKVAQNACAVIWVEPGTVDCSRRLNLVREKLLPNFNTNAPCTHNLSCPLLNLEDKRDWCHHFAQVPTEAFTTEKWKTFSKEMGIDLRSLAVSYLVMSQNVAIQPSSKQRVIGRARIHKGYALVQVCNAKGLEELKIMEKKDKNMIKELKHTPFSYLID